MVVVKIFDWGGSFYPQGSILSLSCTDLFTIALDSHFNVNQNLDSVLIQSGKCLCHIELHCSGRDQYRTFDSFLYFV